MATIDENLNTLCHKSLNLHGNLLREGILMDGEYKGYKLKNVP